MKKLDLRSSVIGILMTVIFFLLTGQSTNDKVGYFDTIVVKNIKATRMQVETLDASGIQVKTLVVTGSMGVDNSGKTVVWIGPAGAGGGAIYLFDRYGDPGWVVTGNK